MEEMKLTQVAAQLYTCRDSLQDAAGIAKTLTRLREIGYTAVQASGLGPISYADFDRILSDTGMLCCATHEGGNDILNSPEKVVERLRTLRCKITAYPFPQGIDLSDGKSVGEWIAKLQQAGEVLAEAGQILCYHNHNHEFRKLGGEVILDLIYNGTFENRPPGRVGYLLGSIRWRGQHRVVQETGGPASDHSPEGFSDHVREQADVVRNRGRPPRFQGNHSGGGGGWVRMVRRRAGHVSRGPGRFARRELPVYPGASGFVRFLFNRMRQRTHPSFGACG